ncbi:MAG TPA: imelysin family protein [Kofleriaceae bacterium]|nr:imelysin family protein [Kofleriaceae bacterium]
MRHNLLSVVFIASLAACVTKSDADFRAEVTATMHTSITQDLAALTKAARDLQAASPTRAWNPVTDAAAIQRMQTAWMTMRKAWEYVEGAIAPMFAGLNETMDARYEDMLGRNGDAYLFDADGVIGMHAIERILFATNIRREVLEFEGRLDGYQPAAYPATDDEAIAFKTQLVQRLIDDASELAASWRPEDVDISLAYQGLVDLMLEQQEKVSLAAKGKEESRYSNVTLFDLRNNLYGTNQVYDLFREWIRAKSAESSDVRIQIHFSSLHDAYYVSPDSDSLPQVPVDWSDDPSPDALRTPFGALWLQIRDSVDPSRPESVVSEMNHIGSLLGFDPVAGSLPMPGVHVQRAFEHSRQ